ncbi:6-bladed beta-propeller [uncultured Piscinibacter sp.]|uniref:6-bladed beta-propeller n=1 Tax=uncultured Piscinibacter sp. TaxID=1131835 RepID=UPI00260D072F|nr:6-bladed beta-propeller [uncultured Piscinibacter sp.]
MPVRRRDLVLPLAALLAGCAVPPRRAAPSPPVWPPPPEIARYRHEATLRDAGSVADELTSARLRERLTGASAMPGFGKPSAVAAMGGRVYVGDTEGRRVFVFDLARRRSFAFGLRLEGELRKPAGIAVDAAGFVHVVDSSARRLIVYDAIGLFQRAIDGGNAWTRPTGVAVSADGSAVHVVDTGGVESDAHRVFSYDAQGRLLRTIGRRGAAPGEFNLPVDAAVAPDGQLWVLDAGNFRVQAFDPDGRFVRAFGSAGNGLGQFGRPRGLAIDRDGLLYISDASFANVQVFQPDGQLLIALGSRGESDGPARFSLPAGVACDETGRLYVVDQFFHKVEVIRKLPEPA